MPKDRKQSEDEKHPSIDDFPILPSCGTFWFNAVRDGRATWDDVPKIPVELQKKWQEETLRFWSWLKEQHEANLVEEDNAEHANDLGPDENKGPE